MVTTEQIIEEVNDRIIEMHTMFDMAWVINKDYESCYNDLMTDNMLKLSSMVETYIPNVERTLRALYGVVEDLESFCKQDSAHLVTIERVKKILTGEDPL